MALALAPDGPVENLLLAQHGKMAPSTGGYSVIQLGISLPVILYFNKLLF
jgi:hypothetical protein